MSKIKYILIGLLIIGMGCKNKKSTQTTLPPAAAETAIITMEQVLNKTNKEWTFFSAKADASVAGMGIDKSFNAVVKMQKDSIVWVSVSLFGIEGLRVFMQPDSITILNKLGKSYSRIGWEEVSAYTGSTLSLSQVQNLFIGNILLPYDSNYRLNKDSSLYFIERILTESKYKIRLDGEKFTMSNGFYRGQKTGKHLSVTYNNYTLIDNQQFPESLDLKAKDGENLFNAKLDFKQIDLTAFDKLPITVPSSFTRE